MAVHERDIIDFVSSKDRCVTLGVADQLTWDDEADHLAQLQAKLNRYMDFIDGGELVDKFPETAHFRPLIRVHFVHAPTPSAEAFLVRTRSAIEAEGVGFSYSQLPPEASDVA